MEPVWERFVISDLQKELVAKTVELGRQMEDGA